MRALRHGDTLTNPARFDSPEPFVWAHDKDGVEVRSYAGSRDIRLTLSYDRIKSWRVLRENPKGQIVKDPQGNPIVLEAAHV